MYARIVMSRGSHFAAARGHANTLKSLLEHRARYDFKAVSDAWKDKCVYCITSHHIPWHA